MSPRPEPSLDVLEAWGQRGVPVGDADAMEQNRAATVDAMARAIRAEKERKVRRRRLFTAFAAAASIAAAATVCFVRPGFFAPEQAAVAVRPPSALEATSGIIVAVRDGKAFSVVPGTPYVLAERDELRTADGAAGLVSFPRGVKVTLSPATHATVVAAGEVEQRVGLALGTVSVSVPHPGGPRTFVVSTPDAQVVVHGTQFTTRVERADDGSTRTFVAVTRGVVSCTNGGVESFITAGQSWASPGKGAVASSANAPSSHMDEKAAPEHGALSSKHVSADALAEQNRLFQAALDARAAGDDAAVVKHLDRLLSRFPTTTLAQEARLARFRALKRLGRDREAAREAGRYLTEHPDAPSRGEALELVNP